MLAELKAHNIDKVTCLRLIVGMIQADEIVMGNEIDHLQKVMDTLELTDAERDIVQQDFINPVPFEKLMQTIRIPESKEARKVLLEQVWKVALSDGVLDPKEIDFSKKLKQHFGVG